MPGFPPLPSESLPESGGVIPGLAEAPAWVLGGPGLSRIPVVISVPHAGRDYPPAVLAAMRDPLMATMRLEDRRVDAVAAAVAARTAAHWIVARAPRAMIDLNRATDDVDGEMFGGVQPGDARPGAPGRRARAGLGLVPRRLPGSGEIWKAPQQRAVLTARIAGIHASYHLRLGALLAEVRARWGAVLLIDLHSMPALVLPDGRPGPTFVLGDRFGSSCDGRLVASAFAHFAAAGELAAHNRPYAGGYVLERHAARGKGVHAVQIEIDRTRYLDARLDGLGEGLSGLVEVLAGLVERLAVETAEMGQGRVGWAEAAE